jgi:hypothetical protein
MKLIILISALTLATGALPANNSFKDRLKDCLGHSIDELILVCSLSGKLLGKNDDKSDAEGNAEENAEGNAKGNAEGDDESGQN